MLNIFQSNIITISRALCCFESLVVYSRHRVFKMHHFCQSCLSPTSLQSFVCLVNRVTSINLSVSTLLLFVLVNLFCFAFHKFDDLLFSKYIIV